MSFSITSEKLMKKQAALQSATNCAFVRGVTAHASQLRRRNPASKAPFTRGGYVARRLHGAVRHTLKHRPIIMTPA